MTDPATTAAGVSYEFWVTTETGNQVPQRTNPTTIETMLRLLDISEGMRVLEIGTGSGYSSALLTGMVGPAGHVVSVDIDHSLVERAAQLHERAGTRNVEVHAVDGALGWPAAAPYDRVVGWTTPHLLPRTWAAQAATAGVILTPVKIATVALANVLVRCRIVDGQPHHASLHPGSFIEMTPHATDELTVPVRYVDTVRGSGSDQSVWISANALHDKPPQAAALLADRLARAAPCGFLTGADNRNAFIAYLLACTDRPASVGTPHGWGLGLATAHSVAVVLSDGSLLAAGTQQASEDLIVMRDRWRQWFDPTSSTYDHIAATIQPDPEGWVIRTRLTDQARE